MKQFYATVFIFGLLLSCNPKEMEKISYLSSEEMTMAAPLLECENLFFTDSVEVAMRFSLSDSSINYTLDGSEVSSTSKTYEKPIRLHKTTVVKAKNFHPEFQSSSAANLKVVKTNRKLLGSKIIVNPEPNERYQGCGASSLNDFTKGTTAFANGNAWLGFQTDSIQIAVDFSEGKNISKVTVSSFANHGAWIFLPKEIKVFSAGQEVGAVGLQEPLEAATAKLEFIDIPITENRYNNLNIVVYAVNEIPKWHQGKGTVAWFFTDEILVE